MKKNSYDNFVNEVLNVKNIGLKPYKTPEAIADHHKCDDEHIRKQIEMGIKVEKEHTKDEDIALAIASHHVYEDKDYYTKLKKVHVEMVSMDVVGCSGYTPTAGSEGTTHKISYAQDDNRRPMSLFNKPTKKKKHGKSQKLQDPSKPLVMRRSIYLGM